MYSLPSPSSFFKDKDPFVWVYDKGEERTIAKLMVKRYALVLFNPSIRMDHSKIKEVTKILRTIEKSFEHGEESFMCCAYRRDSGFGRDIIIVPVGDKYALWELRDDCMNMSFDADLVRLENYDDIIRIQ